MMLLLKVRVILL